MFDSEYQESIASIKDEELSNELSPFSTVEEVLHWAKKLNPGLEGFDLIQQDEFTFDLVLPHSRGWVVFGTT